MDKDERLASSEDLVMDELVTDGSNTHDKPIKCERPYLSQPMIVMILQLKPC